MLAAGSCLLTDVVKPDGYKFESLGIVRDGSESTSTKSVYKKGYHLMHGISGNDFNRNRRWYFLSLYILIVLFSPYLNMVFSKLDKKQYILFSIWPTLADFELSNDLFNSSKIVDTYDGKSFSSFVFLYMIGGFIRRFAPEYQKPKARYLIVIFESIVLFLFFKDLHFTSGIVNV